MRRTNTWQDVQTTGEVELNTGDGVTARIPSGNSAARLAAVEAISPSVQPDDGTYAEVVTDVAGKVTEGTLLDGTKYVPQIRSDGGGIAGEVLSTVTGYDEYAEVTTDLGGRIVSATRSDGTRYYPRISVDEITITGTSPSDPTIATTDVVFMAGQSNSTYAWFSSTDPVLHATDPNLLVWDDIGSTISVVNVGQPDDIPKGIARAMRQQRPDRAVLIVPTAVGGTGFSGTSLDPAPAGYHTNGNGNGTWDRFLTADPKNLALASMAAIKAALVELGSNVGRVSLGWVQGESDASSMTQAAYSAAIDDLFGWYRSELGLPDLPIVVGGLVPERIAAYNTAEKGVVRAHLDTPRRLTRTAYQPGPTERVEYLQLVHYSKPGRALHGEAMAAAVERARLNVANSKPLSPTALTIERSGDMVGVSWVAPPCRATAYNLETSTNGGAWTAATFTNGPLSLTHTMTAPAGATISARISTTNEVGTSYTTEAHA